MNNKAIVDIRSSTQDLLTVPRCRTEVGGGRFSVAEHQFLNSLPKEIRNRETLGTSKKHLWSLVDAGS